MTENLLTLATEWDASLEAAGRAVKTRGNYRQSITSFAAWCVRTDHAPTTESLTRRTIEAWVRWMRTQGYAPRTVLLRWKGLSVFATRLVDEELSTTNPFFRLHAPTVPPDHRPVLTAVQVDAIVAACSGPMFADKRDELAMRLLRDTGVRAGELLSIRVADIDTETRSVLIPTSKSMPRRVGISPGTVAAFYRYRRSRARVPNRDLDALFITRQGPMTYSGLSEMFDRRTAAAGVTTHLHAMRHFAAHNMLRSGMGVDNVARTLGHTSLTMVTKVYAAALAGDRALEAHQRWLAGG